jgi:nitrogen regulatory protein PII-like uncharacterized protein
MDIPEPLWLEICTYLTPKDLCSLALVNRAFCALANSNYSWHVIMLTKLRKMPSALNNFKKNFSEVNHMAIEIIRDYQKETVQLERVIESERIRQRRVLESKQSERLKARKMRLPVAYEESV